MENRKLSKGKVALIVIASIILVVGAFLGVVGILNIEFRKDNLEYIETSIRAVEYEEQLTPTYEEGYWTFTTDDDFKILQLTDIHIGGGWLTKTKDYKAINAVANMVTAEKPDLVIITGDMVEHSKPLPDIYLLACDRLGKRPEECYAIEDSPNGIRSAHAAGMHPLMVPDMIAPDEEMRLLSERIFESLHEVKSFFGGMS